MPHVFFCTIASFEEGNMAKWQKLEPEFEEFSKLSGPSLKSEVHCAVTTISPMKESKVIITSTARSLMGRRPCVSSVARCLLLSLSSSLSSSISHVKYCISLIKGRLRIDAALI